MPDDIRIENAGNSTITVRKGSQDWVLNPPTVSPPHSVDFDSSTGGTVRVDLEDNGDACHLVDIESKPHRKLLAGIRTDDKLSKSKIHASPKSYSNGSNAGRKRKIKFFTGSQKMIKFRTEKRLKINIKAT